MRTIETNVYQFDELSESAKDSAREWFRRHIADDFSAFSADNILDEANRFAAMMGIRVSTRTVRLMSGATRQEPEFFWEVGAYRGTDGASFSGYYSYAPGSVRAITSEAPKDEDLARIVRTLQDCQRRYFYRLKARISLSSYYRGVDSGAMSVEVEYDGADYREVDEATVDAITEAIKDFADWIGRRLLEEYEYLHSDESVDENIRCNEYEFTEDGDRA